ncbi:hypothetical protein BH10CHL1_BH10CHL1_01600 [soil metagenome]
MNADFSIIAGASDSQLKQTIMRVRDEMRLNSYPPNDYPYYHGNIPLLAVLSSQRDDTRYTWFVGYEDVSRSAVRVLVFRHDSAAFDPGTQATYQEFIRRLMLALAPDRAESATSAAAQAKQPQTVDTLPPAQTEQQPQDDGSTRLERNLTSSVEPKANKAHHKNAKHKPGPENDAANKWLIEQYFEVHKGKRKLPYFKDEWLRIREEQGKGSLANVSDSMRQVIKKEKGRRNTKA